MPYVISIVSIIMMIYYIFWSHKNAFYDLIFKSLASFCFLMCALVWMTYGQDVQYMHAMFVGLLFGAIGDVFLALPDCYPKQKDRYFIIGLLSFLIGHLIYAGTFYQTSGIQTWIVVLISIIGGCSMICLLRKIGVNFDRMMIPCMLYAIIILFMEGQAVSHLLQGITAFRVVLNIGTLSFVLSDLVLVFILFGNRHTRNMIRCNLSLYYFAQMSLIMTFLMR